MERAKALRCGVCHVSDFSGQNQVPRLAVAARRRTWPRRCGLTATTSRKGGDTIMAAALYGVSDADIEALAHFLSRLP